MRHHLVFLLSTVAIISRLAGTIAAEPQSRSTLTPAHIMEAFMKVSTGNLADAVEEATGNPGFMNYDMKPIFKTKIVGPASTAVLRRVLKTDARTYPNQALQILDEAPSGNILVYVLEDGLNIAGMGNLMATTAKVRGLAGAVIDGGVRDIEEITQIGFPVYSRSITPATSVGRLVSVSKNEPVTCAGVRVRPGDYIMGDWDGIVVIPVEAAAKVVELIKQYDEKESKMVPIIKETKSMLKALEKYNRY
jgi:4-hydroxy-4-methyl-2-oxoglutarate aldolase